MAIAPRPEQLQALVDHAPPGKSSMLDLPKLEGEAEYADGRQTGLTGAEACGRYGKGAARIIREPGGRSTRRGPMDVLMIARLARQSLIDRRSVGQATTLAGRG